MADCEPIFVPLVPPAFNFDANVLEDAFKQGAKAILICNPSNPSGKVFTYDELKLISELCIKYDAFAIMDEVYEHIVYEGHKHIYMNSLPGMWERTVSCSSLSKTYSITGWRLGYAIAPKPIMDRIKQYHDFNTVGAPSPLMEAAVVGLDMPDSYYKEFGDHYAHMKKLFTDGLKQIGIPLPIRRARTLCWPTSARTCARASPTWTSAWKWPRRSASPACPARRSSMRTSTTSSASTSPRRTKRCTRRSTACPI